MNADTIYLEAGLTGNLLKLSLGDYEGSLFLHEEKKYPESDVRKHCREIAEILNSRVCRTGTNRDALEKIKTTGTLLCDWLLTKDIIEYIENTEKKILEIKIDDHLVHIPWELLCIGNTFLCRRFSMGRIVRTGCRFAKNRRKLPESLKMLILANPENDLENAEKEGKLIERLCDMKGKKYISARCLKSRINADKVKETLRNFDFVHYSGHAEFDSEDPGKNGWKFFHSSFTPQDISEMIGGEMPFFVFSNACESARTDEWHDKSFNMANSFLRAGVRHYLGTFWKIADEPGSRFAQEFYRQLFAGKSIGESVRLSRETLAEEYGPGYIGWADYLLYGNPSTSYFQNGAPAPSAALPCSPSENERDSPKSLQARGGTDTMKTDSPLRPSQENLSARKIFAISLIFAMMIIISVLTIHRIQAGKASAPESPDPEIMKILSERAEQKRQRIDRLYKELEKITGGPVRAEQNSEELSLAMVFDSQIPHYETRNILAHALQAQIREALPELVLLHRKSLDKILEELIREKPQDFTLRFPKLLLFLEVSQSASQTCVLMQLVKKNTSEVSAVFVETLDDSALVLEQREKIAGNLIAHLKKYQEKI